MDWVTDVGEIEDTTLVVEVKLVCVLVLSSSPLHEGKDTEQNRKNNPQILLASIVFSVLFLLRMICGYVILKFIEHVTH